MKKNCWGYGRCERPRLWQNLFCSRNKWFYISVWLMSGMISASGSSDSWRSCKMFTGLYPPPTQTRRPHSLTSMILKVLLFKVGFQLLLSLPFLLHLLLLQLTSNGLQIPQNHVVTNGPGVDKYELIFEITEIGHHYRKQLVSLTKIKEKAHRGDLHLSSCDWSPGYCVCVPAPCGLIYKRSNLSTRLNICMTLC